jgi:hypothetical protein
VLTISMADIPSPSPVKCQSSPASHTQRIFLTITLTEQHLGVEMRGSRQPNHPGRGSSGRGVRYFHPGGRGGGHAPSSSSISNTPSPPLGELINSFSKDALLEDSKSYTDSARIQDDLPVASYNWFKGKEATVLVPGM